MENERTWFRFLDCRGKTTLACSLVGEKWASDPPDPPAARPRVGLLHWPFDEERCYLLSVSVLQTNVTTAGANHQRACMLRSSSPPRLNWSSRAQQTERERGTLTTIRRPQYLWLHKELWHARNQAAQPRLTGARLGAPRTYFSLSEFWAVFIWWTGRYLGYSVGDNFMSKINDFHPSVVCQAFSEHSIWEAFLFSCWNEATNSFVKNTKLSLRHEGNNKSFNIFTAHLMKENIGYYSRWSRRLNIMKQNFQVVGGHVEECFLRQYGAALLPFNC